MGNNVPTLSPGAVNLSAVANGNLAKITGNINNQFVPSFWVNSLLLGYFEKSPIPLITVKPPRIQGNQIIYNEIGPVNVQETTTNEFNGTFTPDQTSFGNTYTIVLDQIAIWSFKIPTVLEVQTNANLFGGKMREAQIALDNKLARNVIQGIYDSASINMGTLDVNPSNIYQTISSMSRQLNWANVPQEGRYLLVDWNAWELIQNDPMFRGEMQITGFLDGTKRKRGAGIVRGQILGFNVIPMGFLDSTQATGSTNATGQIIAMSDQAYAFDLQADIPQVKEGTYGDFNTGMQGLCLYGHGVLRPVGIVAGMLNISFTLPEGVEEVVEV